GANTITTTLSNIIFLINDPAPTDLDTLSLHDALPIYAATASDARAVPLGIEREPAPGCSWALRNTGGVHAPPLAAICLVWEWVRASVVEARLSPRSTSSATFCGSFAAAPCTFRCSSSSRRYA